MTDDRSVPEAELVARARRGDQQAMVELWSRHYPAVLRVARKLSRQPRDAEEMASDAFAGMLAALSSGAGPTGSVRAYLVTSVKNVAVTRSRRSSATDVLTDDAAVFEDGRAVRDPVAHHGELGLMREAFSAIPQRWQTVLWRTAVDRESNVRLAEEFGMSPNAVAALARRARRGLRAAYVQAHVSSHGVARECEPYVRRLADLALEQSRAADDLSAHVETCARCSERLAELCDVERNMAGLLGPALLVLLPPGAGGVGASTAAATTNALGASRASGTSAGSSAAGTAAVVLGGLATVGLAAAAMVSMSIGHRDLVAEARASTSTVSPASRVTPTAVSSSPTEQVSRPFAGGVSSTLAPKNRTPPKADSHATNLPSPPSHALANLRRPRAATPAQPTTPPVTPSVPPTPALRPTPTPTVWPTPAPTVRPTPPPTVRPTPTPTVRPTPPPTLRPTPTVPRR